MAEPLDVIMAIHNAFRARYEQDRHVRRSKQHDGKTGLCSEDRAIPIFQRNAGMACTWRGN